MTKLVFVNSDGIEKSVEAENGLSLMEVARDNDLGIEGTCGGSISCCTCHVIIDKENKVEVPWYHNIDSWDGYCNYLGSEERKLVQRPHPIFMKYHEWNEIGVDDE